MTKCVLAIDLGSGGPKAILLSEEGELLAFATRRIQTFLTPDGGGEQDPEEYWQSITAAAQEVLQSGAAQPQDVLAVAVATQWSVTVPVDQSGQHLMNAVHWTDSRGAPYTKAITGGFPKVAGYGAARLLRWLRMTGGVPTHAGADALAHMLYIMHERPEVYARTYKLLEPMDYINFRLTGKCGASYATAFPYLLTDNRDLNQIRYDDGLIRWSGLDRAKLPDLHPVDHVLGPVLPNIAKLWGLAEGTPVLIGIPDSQSAVIGSGAIEDYRGHICIGTTAWLSCHVPFKRTNIFNYLATMPAGVPGRNMVVAEQGAAGKCLESFVDNWLMADDPLSIGPRPSDTYERIESLVESIPPGSEGLLFLPWLNGAGPPSGDADMRGGLLNLSLRHGRGHAARAIMEGVAYNLRWLRDAVERFIGRRFDSLNFIGGGARSDTWCQALADVLDRPIHRMIDPNFAIARGAAIAALVALGRLQWDSASRIVRVERTFRPQEEHRETYDRLFAMLLKSYRANRPIFHRLNHAGRATIGN